MSPDQVDVPTVLLEGLRRKAGADVAPPWRHLKGRIQPFPRVLLLRPFGQARDRGLDRHAAAHLPGLGAGHGDAILRRAGPAHLQQAAVRARQRL